MKTGATLFGGFEGIGIGMKAAGINHLWSVEYDNDIADVARLNGFNVLTADILDCGPADFEPVNFLHASPPCPNFSNAKTGGEETEADIALAQKVADFIVTMLPDFFTLENVYQYRNSKSWETIARALLIHGYSLNYWHVNMADYGVPQTRRRMIVVARRDGKRPQLPPATHAEKPEVGLFKTLERWVGWYEAVEDLIPELPDSQFAPWQLERLPEELKSYLSMPSAGRGKQYRDIWEPSDTVVSQPFGSGNKAFITVAGDNYRPFIAPGGNTSSFSPGNGDEPARTVDTRNAPRAFIVGDGDNYRPIVTGDNPTPTVSASNGAKAYTSGRVVQMTPRALARFQSFPDWYELPEKKLLACRGIGNAVPPLFAQRLFESMV